MTSAKRVGRARSAAAAAAALLFLAASCGSSDSGSATGSASSGSDGAQLYAENCASCHGAELEGTDKGPSHLSIVYEPGHHPDDAFRSAIANGAPQHHWNFGDMPSIEGLTGSDVDEVIAFIRAEQDRLGFEQ